MVKALAVDIDGTLTDKEGRLDTEAIEALREAERKGIQVILASGNSLCVVLGLRYYLGCSGGAIAENGAVIWYKGRIEVLGNREVALEARRILVERLSHIVRESWQNPHRYADFAFVPREDMPRGE